MRRLGRRVLIQAPVQLVLGFSVHTNNKTEKNGLAVARSRGDRRGATGWRQEAFALGKWKDHALMSHGAGVIRHPCNWLARAHGKYPGPWTGRAYVIFRMAANYGEVVTLSRLSNLPFLLRHSH